MEFVKGVPNLKVLAEDFEFDITTVQEFDEREDVIYLKCAEYVKDFKRGYVCDIAATYPLADRKGNVEDEFTDTNYNLVLVHVNKCTEVTTLPEFEYIFYK